MAPSLRAAGRCPSRPCCRRRGRWPSAATAASCGRRSLRVRLSQQFVEMHHARLPFWIEPPCFVAAGREPLLHRFADPRILDLHPIAELAILIALPMVRAGIVIVEV